MASTRLPGDPPDIINIRTTLFVGDLADLVDNTVLRSAFHTFGYVDVDDDLGALEASQKKEHRRRLGFVEFADPADALAAIENMHDAELFGNVISVSFATDTDLQSNSSEPRAIWDNQTTYMDASGTNEPQTDDPDVLFGSRDDA